MVKTPMRNTLLLKIAFTTLVALLVTVPVTVSAGENPPDLERITQDLYFLASDNLGGRLPGTLGFEIAAEYIKNEFIYTGLDPVDPDGSYFQDFDITSGVSLGSGNFLDVTTPDGTFSYSAGDDFLPLFFSQNASIEGEVIFAGYGITSEEYNWDDYADLDVNGKIVLCFRDEPGRDNPDSQWAGIQPTMYSGLRWKTYNAQNHGAAGLILVTGPAYLEEDEEDEFISLDHTGGFGESGIPVIQVSQEVASVVTGSLGAPLSMFHGEIERHGMAFGALLENMNISLAVDLEREYIDTRNVVGILPGSDPVLKDEWVIVGAHFDHIGLGFEGRYYGEIHNGADDNASGTTGLLELARLFASSPEPPKRSILFIAFSAEELGLLGSSAYLDDPIVRIENTSAMVNMDMIGRVSPDEEGVMHCAIHGSGSAPEWEEIISDTTPDGEVEFRALSDPIGGGDYLNFYLAEIPVINFFSGIHEDYNRPSDDADRINYEGLRSVIAGVYDVVERVANRDAKLTFQEWEVQSGSISTDVSSTGTYSVYLGTIPDFESTGDGFFIVGVTPGSPAEAGGLMGGDRIVRLGEYEITDLYSYSYALGEYDPGDTVDIVVLRDGLEVTVTVTFASREERE
jgi:hypothetical protein